MKTFEEMEEDYLARSALICPRCESTNISSRGVVETDCLSAWQEVKCLDCGQGWKDIFELIGIELD